MSKYKIGYKSKSLDKTFELKNVYSENEIDSAIDILNSLGNIYYFKIKIDEDEKSETR